MSSGWAEWEIALLVVFPTIFVVFLVVTILWYFGIITCSIESERADHVEDKRALNHPPPGVKEIQVGINPAAEDSSDGEDEFAMSILAAIDEGVIERLTDEFYDKADEDGSGTLNSNAELLCLVESICSALITPHTVRDIEAICRTVQLNDANAWEKPQFVSWYCHMFPREARDATKNKKHQVPATPKARPAPRLAPRPAAPKDRDGLRAINVELSEKQQRMMQVPQGSAEALALQAEMAELERKYSVLMAKKKAGESGGGAAGRVSAPSEPMAGRPQAVAAAQTIPPTTVQSVASLQAGADSDYQLRELNIKLSEAQSRMMAAPPESPEFRALKAECEALDAQFVTLQGERRARKNAQPSAAPAASAAPVASAASAAPVAPTASAAPSQGGDNTDELKAEFTAVNQELSRVQSELMSSTTDGPEKDALLAKHQALEARVDELSKLRREQAKGNKTSREQANGNATVRSGNKNGGGKVEGDELVALRQEVKRLNDQLFAKQSELMALEDDSPAKAGVNNECEILEKRLDEAQAEMRRRKKG